MKNQAIAIIILIILIFFFGGLMVVKSKKQKTKPKELATNVINSKIVKLPAPRYESETSVEEAIQKRRSIREYRDKPLTLFEISQLLWAAQGITDKKTGFRSSPSAGALYPLEVYLVVGKVENLKEGVYKYKPKNHELIKVKEGDKREELYESSLFQSWVKEAPAAIVFSAVFERTTQKYGERGKRYVYMEVGHASQNVYLEAVSLNIGTVTVGAFDDKRVKEILNLPKNEEPLYLMPVGKK